LLLSVSQDDIHAAPNSTVNGIDGWSAKAIAGRGILIDYVSWAAEQGFPYDATAAHAISVEDIEAIMMEKNIQSRQGDILILRTGYVPAYLRLSDTEKESFTSASPAWPGLKQGEAMTRWLWEQQFAALAADNAALECIRKYKLELQLISVSRDSFSDRRIAPADMEWQLHPILLAGWGTPIGEFFDLEALATMCKNQNRWSFFFTSVPLNYSGAVASPPNAMALF
jgi:hypothetical protein